MKVAPCNQGVVVMINETAQPGGQVKKCRRGKRKYGNDHHGRKVLANLSVVVMLLDMTKGKSSWREKMSGSQVNRTTFSLEFQYNHSHGCIE